MCVDGAHALGSVPVDLSAPEMAGVDVYIGNGHKWLYTCRGECRDGPMVYSVVQSTAAVAIAWRHCHCGLCIPVVVIRPCAIKRIITPEQMDVHVAVFVIYVC